MPDEEMPPAEECAPWRLVRAASAQALEARQVAFKSGRFAWEFPEPGSAR